MTRSLSVSTLLGASMLLACGDPLPVGTGGSTTTGGGESDAGQEASGVPTSGGSTTEASGGTTEADFSSGDPGTTGGTTGSTGEVPGTTFDSGSTCGFICPTSDDEPHGYFCDVFKQDCPDGEKCTAYAEGGGSSWNTTKCVPVTGDGTPGDVCKAEGGGVSGLDDCQKGAMCWDVDDMDMGICVELCTGTEAAPVCSNEQEFNCAVVNNGVLNLCLPACDPLVQDCQGDDLCIPAGDTFVCVLDASGADTGKALDPCEFANACDKGLLCRAPTASGKCDANAGGCCMPFCDLADQMAADEGCKLVADDTSCVSLFEEGMAPPEFETVGICVVPV